MTADSTQDAPLFGWSMVAFDPRIQETQAVRASAPLVVIFFSATSKMIQGCR